MYYRNVLFRNVLSLRYNTYICIYTHPVRSYSFNVKRKILELFRYRRLIKFVLFHLS